MATNLSNKDPIKPKEHEPMLRNLQGNILKGHGRKYSRCIFLELKSVADLCVRLGRMADKIVTSAWKQYIESQDFRHYQIPSTMFGNLFLTAKGYEKLGINCDTLKKELGGSEEYFLQGMTKVHKDLQDPDPKTTWEAGYKDGRIDAMILLADNNEELLEREVGKLMTELREFSEILAYERGNDLQKGGQSVEHFGFGDGISQPILVEPDSGPLKDEARKPWDPCAPLELVLVEDPLVKLLQNGSAKAEDCFGSYFVFRKLEQDVIGFEHGKRLLVEQLGLKESDHQKVGAMMIGRFEDGTPLALSDNMPVSRTGNRQSENTFNYDGPKGHCPMFAHIRATNRRDGKEKRIARRGIPYGKRASWNRLPTEPVGLLFMCFQANIKDQFASIQIQANKEDDPIIGQSPRDQADPLKRNLPAFLAQKRKLTEEKFKQENLKQEQAMKQQAMQEQPSFAFDTSWVKLRGGEFFFAPSIPFLAALKKS